MILQASKVLQKFISNTMRSVISNVLESTLIWGRSFISFSLPIPILMFFLDWVCVKKTTGWNQESSLSYYLDRHDTTCGNAGVVKRFQLRRDYKGKFQYEYTCCNPGIASSGVATKETKANDAGNGKTYYLDRHTVDCGANSLISQFKLNRPCKDLDFLCDVIFPIFFFSFFFSLFNSNELLSMRVSVLLVKHLQRNSIPTLSILTHNALTTRKENI